MSNNLNYTPADLMICVMSRLIRNGDIAFHGVASHMPLLAILLAKRMHAPDAVHLNIPGGVDPDDFLLSDYSTAGGELLTNADAVFALQEIFDLSMRGQLDVAFLSGIQFDGHGNVNASVIGDYHRPKVRMPGGAGSAVLIPTVKRAILWRTKHDVRTFVEKVDFITTHGNINRIVTPLCCFRQDNGRIMVDSIHPYSNMDEVRENTGFDLGSGTSAMTPPPTEGELKVLNTIDPRGLREIEF